jgi:hypothetical protein
LNKPEAKRFGFVASETPCFVGRAVAALAADPRVLKKSGGVYASCTLAEEYGFTDIDGSRPDWKHYFAENFKAMLEAPTKTGFEWTLTRSVAEGKRKKAKGKRNAEGKSEGGRASA